MYACVSGLLVIFFRPVQERLSGADLQKFQNSEAAFNTAYGASVKTEHAFNGLGVLDKVTTTRVDGKEKALVGDGYCRDARFDCGVRAVGCPSARWACFHSTNTSWF